MMSFVTKSQSGHTRILSKAPSVAVVSAVGGLILTGWAQANQVESDRLSHMIPSDAWVETASSSSQRIDIVNAPVLRPGARALITVTTRPRRRESDAVPESQSRAKLGEKLVFKQRPKRRPANNGGVSSSATASTDDIINAMVLATSTVNDSDQLAALVTQWELPSQNVDQDNQLEWAMMGEFVPGLQWYYAVSTDGFSNKPLMLLRPKRRPASVEEVNCLAQAIYFEARGEIPEGRVAVAETILNRVGLDRYPDTICGVIQQGMEVRHRCQFSYNCDGEAEVITELQTYIEIRQLAEQMLSGDNPAITDGATHFHTVDVKPYWASVYKKTAAIGSHLFYRGNR